MELADAVIGVGLCSFVYETMRAARGAASIRLGIVTRTNNRTLMREHATSCEC